LLLEKKIIYTYTYPLGYNYTSLNSWGRKEMSQQSWSFDWFDGETLRRGMTTQTPKEEGYTVQPRIFCDKSRHAALVSDIELISIFSTWKQERGRWKRVGLFLIHSWQPNTLENVVDSRRNQRSLQKLSPKFSAMPGIPVFLAKNTCCYSDWCKEH